MGRLIGYMANRSDRLSGVFDQEREAIAPPADSRPDAWGIGFYQGGEVLHKKRPREAGDPINWEKVARGVRSDCVLIHFREATVGDYRADNTHPFRMRQWLFAHNGTVEGFPAVRERLVDSLPDFLRRNIQGSTDSECIFHLLLSFLHDAGHLDLPDGDAAVILRALRSTTTLVERYCTEVEAPPPELNLMLTNGRTLFALRHGRPVFYAERTGLPTDVPGRNRTGSFRYVVVSSNGLEQPAGYQELPAHSVLVVDRNLAVDVRPLME